MPRNRCKFLFASGLPEEPTGFWRFEFELEGPVGEGSEFDFERNVSSYMGCNFIELFAEFHHVDTQRTKRLTHFWVGLSDSSVYSKVDSCCLKWEVPL